MIRAVVLGYDLCCRLSLALGRISSGAPTGAPRERVPPSGPWAQRPRSPASRRAAHALRALLCGPAGLPALELGQDEDHIEKAFDFAGMGARNGVTAVTMVQAGLTGVADVLDGTHNLFIALSTDPKPEAMLDGLGSRYFISETAIKTFSVGYPIQSPLDAILTLRERHGLRAADVQRIVVHLPTDAVGIVGHSAMPNVNCQHLVALALVRGPSPSRTAMMRA